MEHKKEEMIPLDLESLDPIPQLKIRKWIPRSAITFLLLTTIFGGTMIGVSVHTVEPGTADYYWDGTIYLSGTYIRAPWNARHRQTISLGQQQFTITDLLGEREDSYYIIKSFNIQYIIVDLEEYVKTVLKMNGEENFSQMLTTIVTNEIEKLIAKEGFDNISPMMFKARLLVDHPFLAIKDLSYTTPIISQYKQPLPLIGETGDIFRKIPTQPTKLSAQEWARQNDQIYILRTPRPDAPYGDDRLSIQIPKP
jgi:hypothetical protein